MKAPSTETFIDKLGLVAAISNKEKGRQNDPDISGPLVLPWLAHKLVNFLFEYSLGLVVFVKVDGSLLLSHFTWMTLLTLVHSAGATSRHVGMRGAGNILLSVPPPKRLA
jgi:hypothetical protein